MKRLFSRTLVILFVIVLVSSSLGIMPAFAEEYQTTAYCSVEPNPTGPGQTALILGWIMPAPPAGFVYHNCFFGITAPSSSYETFGPLSTDPTGLVYIEYTFNEIGDYSIDFWMLDEDIAGDTYLGDSTHWGTDLPLVVSVSPSSITMDVGQSQTFTSTVSGGTPPYSYYWYLDGNVVSGATDDTWTYTPSAAEVGSHNVSLLAVDDEGIFAFSSNVPVTVNAPPSVGITVSNVVDVAPSSEWSYRLWWGEAVVEEFTLPTDGSISFSDLDPGTYWLDQTIKFGYYCSSTTVDSVEVTMETWLNYTSITLDLLSGDDVSVVFNNALIPEASFVKPVRNEDTSPPETSTTNIPNRRAIPVQAAWNPDIEPDDSIDLVMGKPLKIIVNLLDVLYEYEGPVALSDFVQVSLTSASGNLFGSDLVSDVLTGQEIKDNSIIFFSLNPPSIIGDDTITCNIRYGSTQPPSNLINPQYTTDVSVKATSELSLHYSRLYRTDSYESESTEDFEAMVTNTRDFVEAVYPVSGVESDSNSQEIEGAAYEPNFLGMLKDCQLVEQQAKLRFLNSANAIGVAIAPDLRIKGGYENYFAYHGAVSGKKTAVGVSFGPAVKGVVALDGYYSVAAHEIGHTFGLYYGIPEQYTLYNPGKPAYGFNVEQNEWRNGYDFMGLSPFQSTTSVWVTSDPTFEQIFSNLKTPGDPGIILVNGIIYDNGDVDLPLTWYTAYGTPDTVPEGQFELRFLDGDDETVGMTSFEAQFFVHLDPGAEVGEDLQEEYENLGTIPVNFAGFAFATTYPEETVSIELWDMTKPVGEQLIKTVSADFVEEAVHDVEAASQVADPTEVSPGDVVDIEVTVRNNGAFTETFDLTCYADCVEIGTILVVDLAPGEVRIVTFTVDTTGAPEGEYSVTAWADSSQVIAEVDEANNWCTDPTKVIVKVPVQPGLWWLWWLMLKLLFG